MFILILLPLSALRSEVHPKWYFTSPSKISSSKSLPSNSLKISLADFPKILVNTLSLPLWAIPMTNCFTPISAALSTTASIAGISDSFPSSENLFWPTYFVCKNASKETAWLSFRSMCFLRSASKLGWLSFTFSQSCIHWTRSGFLIYIYSTPIASQYMRCKWLIICRNSLGSNPITSPALNTVPKSPWDKPKFSISRVGTYFLLSLTGLVLVNKWPLLRYASINFTTWNSLNKVSGICTDCPSTKTGEPLKSPMPTSSRALSIPKSNPWKKARQLGSTLSGFARYLSYNSAKKDVCAVFKKEYLSINANSINNKKLVQKYNN